MNRRNNESLVADRLVINGHGKLAVVKTSSILVYLSADEDEPASMVGSTGSARGARLMESSGSDDDDEEQNNSFTSANSYLHSLEDLNNINLAHKNGPSSAMPSSRESASRRVSRLSNTESERTVTIRRRPSSVSIASSRSSRHDSVHGSSSSARPSNIKKRPTFKNARSVSMQGHAHTHRIFSADDTEMEIQRDANAVLSRTMSDYASRPYNRRLLSSAGKNNASEQALLEADEYEDGLEEAPEIIDDDEDDADQQSLHSNASDESFTLKERQDAINKSHPFGIKIWKPAIYKKKRSVQKAADGEIHSTPGRQNFARLSIGNILWALLFGWWMSLLVLFVSILCHILAWSSGKRYGKLCFGLAQYIVYPFGQYIELKRSDRYAEEDEGLGDDIRDIDDIEQLAGSSSPTTRAFIGRSASSASFQAHEREPLLGFVGGRTNTQAINPKRRAFGRGKWNFGRIVFFILFYFLIAPCMLLICGLCWLCVFPLPMAKICFALIHHLRSHPLALTFHWDIQSSLTQGASDRRVVLCTYRAMGWQYYKYTVDGTVRSSARSCCTRILIS